MPFEPGQSGNPAGRRVGSRNKRSTVVDHMLEGELELIVRAAIEMALRGDVRAMRLLLDRVEPARKDRPVDFELPPLATEKDSVLAFARIASGVANGDLTPIEAASLSKVVARHVLAIEAVDFEERLTTLEKKNRIGGAANP